MLCVSAPLLARSAFAAKKLLHPPSLRLFALIEVPILSREIRALVAEWVPRGTLGTWPCCAFAVLAACSSGVFLIVHKYGVFGVFRVVLAWFRVLSIVLLLPAGVGARDAGDLAVQRFCSA